MKTQKEGIHYDLDVTLYDIRQGYRWGDGRFSIDGEVIGIQVPIPKASVRGMIAINGDTVQVAGKAFMDHTYQSNITPRIFTEGYRFIKFKDDGWESGYFLMADAQMPEQVIGFGMRNESGRSPELMEPQRVETLETGSISGNPVSRKIRVSYRNNGTRVLERTEDYETYPLLMELSGLKYRIARRFLGGEVIEFPGRCTDQRQRRRLLQLFYCQLACLELACPGDSSEKSF